MKKIIELPIIICGEIKYPEGDNYIEINYENDVLVRITRPSKEDFKRIFDYSQELHKVPLAHVSRYMTVFARKFLNPMNPIRQEAVELSSYVTGYSKEMLDRDYGIISAYLSARHTSYEMLEAEFGDWRITEEWVRNKVARVRAFPRGRVFHILVGNVPIAGMYSVVRSILTKNQTVVKLASRDIISTLFFMKALIESNENGPEYRKLISSSLSAFYLEKESDDLVQMINSADMVCAWGKGESLRNIKKLIPHSVPFLEFGPKRSFSLLFIDDTCDVEKAAIRMAHDLSIYDQEACLSPQQLFIIGDSKEYLKKLQKWLDWQSESLSRGIVNSDAESHIIRTGLEAKYRGWEVMEGRNKQWNIILCNPYDIAEHPLGRTLFIHQIEKVEDMIPFIDDETQAISIYPYDDRAADIGELFCSHGASKICETGMVAYPREGWTHDGMYPLHYFVRLCYLDENMGEEYKYEDHEGACSFLSNMYGNPQTKLDEFEKLFPFPK